MKERSLFKKIPHEYYLTILDRLTRFCPAKVRYKRVIEDLINKFYLGEKKNLSEEEKIEISKNIFNQDLKKDENDLKLIKIFKNLEEKYFFRNEFSPDYLSIQFNYSSALKLIKNENNISKNLKWLLKISFIDENLTTLRNQNSLLYPIEKILLCEGQTEFLLLNTIFKLFDYDLDKLGIFILQAGGKNAVVRKYYSMVEYTKLPFFILLDKDGSSVKDLIKTKIRSIDKLYLLKSGEFEDLIPKEILLKTINLIFSNDFQTKIEDFNDKHRMVENLENIYKKYGYGDFKKAQFANSLNEFIKINCKLDDFLNSEIKEIIKLIS